MIEQGPENKIGMKIYYDLNSGNAIVITPESAGIVVETTREQDFKLYKALDDKVPESVGMIQLEHGEYSLDRAEGGIIERVDLGTLKPLFSYPNPIAQEPQVPGISLSDQISDLNQRLLEANEQNGQLAEESTLNQIALMELHAMMLSLMPPEEAAPTEEVPAEDVPVEQAPEETANEE
ncbi:hypothetical protein J2W91_002442 [Paenibacillus amylolyticus]|uniref:Uncharacterized protein n=1 Tax=Paenibacillus amylolyticus TaxID=1451 RepID=A0AAP5LNS3_PAEAM|nr:hypothetical protein [Paenibacillus amylolyticus]MDR6723980.1 hypothetical protein [Paenibacillus amylolyticus]